MIERYMSPDQVSEATGISTAHLAQLRYMGKGPKFYKPTAKKVLYKEAEVQQWVEESARFATN